MKRKAGLALLAGILLLGVSRPGVAQEGETGQKAANGESGEEVWRVANFVLLAAGLAFLVGKNAGPFFAARTRKIREEIVKGEEAREEAEKSAAEVDRRLANLEADIASLRADSHKETEHELEGMRQRTAEEIGRIRFHAQQEIAAAGKTARAELKRFSAELAIGLAERKIRARMNAQTQDDLVSGFVREVNRPAPGSEPL